ncbi:MAG: prepilin-type N-terminal cleavage/methylation domain-containing protein [Candidatus Omnitrophica bacterium]|nr:prepilin-type N-terminal cleavage/methylation domain-containing protein [Candidatus Omnitrophota bacterium]
MKLSSKGFTLLEIMSVVAIIVILAAIVLPNVLNDRAVAQKNACIANLYQIMKAKVIWANENNKQETDLPGWADLVPEYIKEQPSCPANGVYAIRAVNSYPTCTVSGHTISE